MPKSESEIYELAAFCAGSAMSSVTSAVRVLAGRTWAGQLEAVTETLKAAHQGLLLDAKRAELAQLQAKTDRMAEAILSVPGDV